MQPDPLTTGSDLFVFISDACNSKSLNGKQHLERRRRIISISLGNEQGDRSEVIQLAF